MDLGNNVSYKSLIRRLLVFAAILLALFVIFKFLLPFFIPFVIALVIAMLNEPIVMLLNGKLRVPRKAASFASLLLTVSIIGLLIVAGTQKIYRELVALQDRITDYVKITSESTSLYEYLLSLAAGFGSSDPANGNAGGLEDLVKQAAAWYKELPPVVSNAIEETLKEIVNQLRNIVTATAGSIFNTVKSLPRIIIYVIFTILSAYFISSDKELISDFIKKLLSKRLSERFSHIRKEIFIDLWDYLKSTVLLMSITFAAVLIVLSALGVEYAFLMAIIVSIGEVIPFVGTGIILIPWIFVNIAAGRYIMALGLTAIYILTIISRHVLKPRVMRSKIGIHPLLTLISMYLGIGVFGLPGIVFGPVIMVIMKNLQASGLINIINEPAAVNEPVAINEPVTVSRNSRPGGNANPGFTNGRPGKAHKNKTGKTGKSAGDHTGGSERGSDNDSNSINSPTNGSSR